MKKGIFGGWFKELASLIFTQTVQAFLLAIIMSIIVNALTANGGTGGTYGAGLLAIIALSQFNKIELLIKNIFGVGSQYGGDMQSGKGGLLGSMMALKMGKNLLDNGKKIADGKRQSKLAGRELANLQNEKKNLSLGNAADDAEMGAQDALNMMGDTADKFIGDAQTGAGYAAGANMVNGGNSNGGVGMSSSQVDQLISAVKEQTSTLKSQKADSDKKDLTAKLNELDKKILDAKNKQDAGKRLANSGRLENLGGFVAGGFGAMAGLAQGDNVVKNAITGAGMADRVVSYGMERRQSKANYKNDMSKLDIDTGAINDSVQSTQNRINAAQRETAVYNAVTNSLKKAQKNESYMKNSTSQQRSRVVKKLQENTKKKIDISNMN